MTAIPQDRPLVESHLRVRYAETDAMGPGPSVATPKERPAAPAGRAGRA